MGRSDSDGFEPNPATRCWVASPAAACSTAWRATSPANQLTGQQRGQISPCLARAANAWATRPLTSALALGTMQLRGPSGPPSSAVKPYQVQARLCLTCRGLIWQDPRNQRNHNVLTVGSATLGLPCGDKNDVPHHFRNYSNNKPGLGNLRSLGQQKLIVRR